MLLGRKRKMQNSMYSAVPLGGEGINKIIFIFVYLKMCL